MGIILGTIIGVKGDTRSLDSGSYGTLYHHWGDFIFPLK